MKNGKKAAALGLALALALSLTACGPKTPAQAIEASQKKLAAVKSMDSSMLMEMELGMADQSMTMNTQMDMAYFTEPTQIKIDMTMDMGELGSQQTTMYAAKGESGDYTLYGGADGQWMSQTMTVENFEQYDSRSSMDLYLGSATGFTADGTEKLDGGEADKYTGVISGESLESVLEGSGALDSLSAIIGSTSSLGDIYKDMADMPVSVWVDKASGYPVRYTMEMTETMSTIMGKALEAAGVDSGGLTISKMSITMDCSNFNNATAFTIPAEALAAAG